MQVPTDYSEYFQRSTQFLEEQRWLIDFAVTKILVEDVFSKIPALWVNSLNSMEFSNLSSFVNGTNESSWPSTLVEFKNKCNSLTLSELLSSIEEDTVQVLSEELSQGLSIKKQYEVGNLVKLIYQTCQQTDIEGIVDVGAGMGYLDRVLGAKGYPVLGIERESKHVTKATAKIQNAFPSISNQVSFVTCELSEGNTIQFFNILKHFIQNSKIENSLCLVGLHTCGDLVGAALKMFLQTPMIKSLVIVPCCYHKMMLAETESVSQLKQFPISKTLSEHLTKSVHREIFYRPFLRLASQQSFANLLKWSEDDYKDNAFYVMSRAVLELYVVREGYQIKKRHRRAARENKKTDFPSFLEDVKNRYDFIVTSSNETIEKTSDKFRSILQDLQALWDSYKGMSLLAEIIVVLQMLMQPVAETFVILDFLCFLKENNVAHIDVRKTFDYTISPRCLSIIATKTD